MNAIPKIEDVNRLFEEDMGFTSRFKDEIMAIVGRQAFSVASQTDDLKKATDFVCRPIRLASRMRRSGYADKYKYDFTIRSWRKSGAETELSKILGGCADWMFYGHATEAMSVGLWYLIDLDVFRDILAKKPGQYRWSDVRNYDGTTAFRSFDLRSFEDIGKLVIAAREIPAYDPLLGKGEY